ncbi:uncharacterized protein LOC126264454 [Aethina tumida]|uniref:uncharacterized protein LOC126264454 n=1 Tax=Aethina tumida TaxID=116153 RepID=UPI002148355E|nr:uncharacterized protein LOC126264454 [Aethina tumida]
MATVPSTAPMEQQRRDTQPIPKSKRKLQKHLRSAGLAYISRTGKLIPAKRVAEELCQCPQKCDDRVPSEARTNLFKHFYGLGEADLQNQFLRDNMDLRARLNVPESTGSGRPPRRITCKYLVPLLPSDDKVEVCQKAFVSAFVITTKRVRLQREKLISSLGLNSYSSHNRSKNNNNLTAVNHNHTSSRVESLEIKKYLSSMAPLNLPLSLNINVRGRHEDAMEEDDDEEASLSPEPKSPAELAAEGGGGKRSRTRRNNVDNPLIPMGLYVPDGVTIAPVTATPDHDRDIAKINNFFSNQLWKPEYIGAYS